MTREAIQASVFFIEERMPESVLLVGDHPSYYGKGSACTSMNILIGKAYPKKEDRLAFLAWLLGFDRLESTKQLTIAQAIAVCRAEAHLPQLTQEFANARRQSPILG